MGPCAAMPCRPAGAGVMRSPGRVRRAASGRSQWGAQLTVKRSMAARVSAQLMHKLQRRCGGVSKAIKDSRPVALARVDEVCVTAVWAGQFGHCMYCICALKRRIPKAHTLLSWNQRAHGAQANTSAMALRGAFANAWVPCLAANGRAGAVKVFQQYCISVWNTYISVRNT